MTEKFPELMNEYVTGTDSYRCLAQKHGISRAKICKLAKEQGWVAARGEFRNALSKNESDANADFSAVLTALLRKVDAAVTLLENDNPDLAKIKQLTAILKDLRDLAPQKSEAVGTKVLFVGKAEDFSA